MTMFCHKMQVVSIPQVLNYLSSLHRSPHTFYTHFEVPFVSPPETSSLDRLDNVVREADTMYLF